MITLTTKNQQVENYFQTADRISIRYAIHCAETPRNGSVILLPGRSEFIEKYTETIRELNDFGFDVYSMDWRGQGLSSRMLKNPHKGYIRYFQAYINDLNQFIETFVVPNAAGRIILIAHSMGGHIALRYLHDHPHRIYKAILLSPMIDIYTFPIPMVLVRLLTWIARKSGKMKHYVIGTGDFDFKRERRKRYLLTSDWKRHEEALDQIRQNPSLALGGITYQWLSAALDSIRFIKQPDVIGRIRTPILMVCAGKDRIVSVAAQKKISKALPNCRSVIIPNCQHEILQETDRIRNRFWSEFHDVIPHDKA